MTFRRIFWLTALCLLPFTATASAASVTFSLDVEFSGATPPAGTTPWITATFDDTADAVGANGVRLTMANTNLVGTEFVRTWMFNFDPLLNPNSLTFTKISAVGVGTITPTTDNTNSNANFKADGDGFFDIKFAFPNSGTGRFGAGESVVYDLTYISPISASSFDFSSVPGGGNGTFKTAAHVQGIGSSGNSSGWVGPDPNPPIGVVPEPMSLLLLGSGLLGIVSVMRFRKR